MSDHQPRVTKFQRQIQTSPVEIILILPNEIIAEILSRLPVKSLLRFRCVSKSWRSLISSKHFIEAHLKISRSSQKRTILTILVPFNSLKTCSLRSLLCGPVSDAVDFDYPMKNPKNSVRVAGSCNGLVCIAINGKHFFLWNTSTRQYKKLPHVDDKMGRVLFISKYGFGFDESNEDYKVAGILSGFCDSGRYETIVKIYSMRSNSWKRIDVFKDGLPFDDSGKFVNGKLHWGRRCELNTKWDIVSFDLGSELCATVAQPRYVETGFCPSLGVLDGCLCVLCDFPKVCFDVWILKEYGVRESWMKVVSVPYLDYPRKGPYFGPLCIGLKGEILLVYGSRFVMFDPREGLFRQPKIRNLGTFLEADVYVESLVSIESQKE